MFNNNNNINYNNYYFHGHALTTEVEQCHISPADLR
jgi:hypothetical protein